MKIEKLVRENLYCYMYKKKNVKKRKCESIGKIFKWKNETNICTRKECYGFYKEEGWFIILLCFCFFELPYFSAVFLVFLVVGCNE